MPILRSRNRLWKPQPLDNENGLVGGWTFDEGGAFDWSGYGRNGTLVNSPTLVQGPTNGWGLTFNGSTQYIGNTLASGLSGSFTFSVWVYSTANDGRNNMAMTSEVAVGYTNYWSVIQKRAADNKAAFALFDGTNNPEAIAANALPLDRWINLTGVRDVVADKIYLYQNAELQGAGTTDSTTSTPTYSAFNIGAQVNVVNRYFAGRIWKPRVFLQDLTPAEVDALYRRELSILCSPDDWEMPPVNSSGFSYWAVRNNQFVLGTGVQ